MKNRPLPGRPAVIAAIAVSIVSVQFSSAFAWGDRHHGGSREVVVVDHHRYHYRDGRFYRPGWFGIDIVIGAPPVGAIFARLPFGYRTVILGGGTYYYYDDIYYAPCTGGYVVVDRPPVIVTPSPVVVTSAPAASEPAGVQEAITVNVPNSQGSFTPVRLTKYKDGYIGPQGEYYPGHPTVEQLRTLYGS